MLKLLPLQRTILASLTLAGFATILAIAQTAPQELGNGPLVLQFKNDGGNPPPVLSLSDGPQSGTNIVIDDHEQSGQNKLKTSFIVLDASSELIKDKPYSAEAVTETTQTLPDGNRIVRHFENKYYRDAAGRTRREQTFGALKPANEIPNEVKIFIYDPVAKINYVLDPGEKSARKMPYSKMPMEVHVMNIDKSEHAQSVASLPPLAPMPSMPGGPGLMQVTLDSHDAHDSVEEDLGTRTIEGLACTGKRTTTTLPAGSIGNERPIVITDETWYSKDIEATVMTVTNDPRMGETRYTLQNVERGEQPLALFEPPADYKLEADKR